MWNGWCTWFQPYSLACLYPIRQVLLKKNSIKNWNKLKVWVALVNKPGSRYPSLSSWPIDLKKVIKSLQFLANFLFCQLRLTFRWVASQGLDLPKLFQNGLLTYNQIFLRYPPARFMAGLTWVVQSIKTRPIPAAWCLFPCPGKRSCSRFHLTVRSFFQPKPPCSSISLLFDAFSTR